tara:strand:- start:638 stop:1072 length:435 start_codon:yes stop_codon:yes gene_type:complete
MKNKFLIFLGVILFFLIVIIIWSAIVPPQHDYQLFYQNITCRNDQIFKILDTNFTCIAGGRVSLNIERGPYFFDVQKLKIIPSGESEHREEILNLSEIGPNEARTRILREDYLGVSSISIIPVININSREVECVSDSIDLKLCA